MKCAFEIVDHNDEAGNLESVDENDLDDDEGNLLRANGHIVS